MSEKNQTLAVEPQAKASTLTEQETKQILTPFAFEIDKSLFGLPLSVPWKRGVALLIDFILVAILAETPGELLAFVAALTFFKIGSKKRAEKMGKKRGLGKLLFRILGVFMLFVMLISTVPEMIDSVINQNEQSKTDKTSSALAVPKNEIDIETPLTKEMNATKLSTVNEHSNDTMIYRGVEWAKGIINDLGLSFGWAALYFSVFTAMWNGQTPGKKLLKIRVIQLDGTPLSVWDSFGRYGGYGAGLATGLLGFLQIYWDPNRQAIHDKISSTIVIDLKKLEHMNNQ